jgi:hypothetical protein
MSEADLDKSCSALPPEVLAVLPQQGHQQIELAHSITCHAYLQQVNTGASLWRVLGLVLPRVQPTARPWPPRQLNAPAAASLAPARPLAAVVAARQHTESRCRSLKPRLSSCSRTWCRATRRSTTSSAGLLAWRQSCWSTSSG